MSIKIGVEGEARLVSVYENEDSEEKYFARLSLCLENYGKSGDKSFSEIDLPDADLPISREQYTYLRKKLKNQSNELSNVNNSTVDTRLFLRLDGNLELKLNPGYRVGKIHNIRNGFPYWVDKEKIKKSMGVTQKIKKRDEKRG